MATPTSSGASAEAVLPPALASPVAEAEREARRVQGDLDPAEGQLVTQLGQDGAETVEQVAETAERGVQDQGRAAAGHGAYRPRVIVVSTSACRGRSRVGAGRGRSRQAKGSSVSNTTRPSRGGAAAPAAPRLTATVTRPRR